MGGGWCMMVVVNEWKLMDGDGWWRIYKVAKNSMEKN